MLPRARQDWHHRYSTVRSSLRSRGVTATTSLEAIRDCLVRAEPRQQVSLIDDLIGSTSPIRRVVEKKPTGGHHQVCFEVDDFAEAVAAMRDKGASVLGAPRIGAHRALVTLFRPKDMGGVLIELMQTSKKKQGVLAELRRGAV